MKHSLKVSKNGAYQYYIIIVAFFVFVALFMGEIGSIGAITIISVLVYVMVLAFSLYKKKYFYLSFVFIILFFPSAINNVIPAFGTAASNGEFRLVSIINHIDIFLILNIIRYKYNKIRVKDRLLTIALFILFISTIVNLVFVNSTDQIKMLTYGTYNLRFLIYFSFIPVNEIIKYKREIGLSIFYGIIFILIEATIFTFVNGNERLASGSLATNTFGNLLAALLVLLLFSKTILTGWRRIISILLLILGVLLTGNRTSLFVLAIVSIVVIIFNSEMRRYIVHLIFASSLIIAIMFMLKVDFSRYDIKEIVDNIEYSSGSGIEVERFGITSSLYSRFSLYYTSIEMIKDRPIIGIGNGTWNDKKREYGFNTDVLIDSHNSYLTIISQFGWFSVLYIILIYIRPSFRYFKKVRNSRYIHDFNLIILFFLFAAFFNSDINKYQVAAFLSFIVIMNLQMEQN